MDKKGKRIALVCTYLNTSVIQQSSVYDLQLCYAI